MRLTKLSRFKNCIIWAMIAFLVIKFAVLPIYRFRKRNMCQPIDNVLFLKTHKTGGSSIANILFRFAKSRHLTVALPKKQIFSFFWPWSFQLSFVDNLGEKRPNLLSSHARYNQTTMQALMPNGTKFITILRHPISRFESAFLFEDFPAFLGISGSLNPLKNLMEDIDKFNPEISTMYTLRNSMSFDLGLEPEDFENADAVSNLIHSVKKNFDLVLLVEYFDESLILLKQQFCWSLEDVIYVKHNSRLQAWKKHHIPNKFKTHFLEWNKADVLLYDHFNETFWNIVKYQDENFWSEVRLLKKMSRKIAEDCLQPGEHKHDNWKKTVGKLILNQKMDPRMEPLCKDLVQDEDFYLKIFRDLQCK
ncbi:galactose-3-O-sulfotransferase 2-like isoform X3 [Acropora palmata]|uniref:galactose-3-O-sulfotransferase 2-like isoform X3 n=1 Tax=Acropora palmata TaxID=6131 RepID=UPI003DA0B966